MAALTNAQAFAAYLAPLRNSEWVVYTKRPFGGPAEVLRYLARYTHRVTISNRRLVALNDTVVGFINGKSAIHLARVYGEKKRNFVGQHFWARGYFVSTVGRDQEQIREYIKKQEAEDTRLEQLNLWR
jgi:hypothetical protein